ncbi:MAG: hypothetical protein JWM19_3669 [Actinomycetia bacterium]|nr:hypothetical protein [Actinomycetes bacterium]
MRALRRFVRYKIFIPGFLFVLAAGLVAATGGAEAAPAAPAGTGTSTTSSLGTYTPTFVGPAAAGCSSGCDLLTGPTRTPSTDSFKLGPDGKPSAAAAAAIASGKPDTARVSAKALSEGAAILAGLPKPLPSPVKSRSGEDPAPATLNCPGAGCDPISHSAGGAKGVIGIDAVDSATEPTVPAGNADIEPPDQGLCAGNGYVVEDDNIGEILVYNTALRRQSSVIPLDTIMGLTAKGWSSGGDISCDYDPSNGGHWFFTEFASASTEASGGPFSGCFNAVANACYESIAVTKGSSPYGPYNVYFLNANYNPSEPGAPYLLNDFAKIAVTRDAFLVFYDEFPLSSSAPGIGGGAFNGAQELAFDKTALEEGAPATLPGGAPNPRFTVAIENMGLLPTPNGTCASDDTYSEPGITCWYSVIPANPPDASQFDDSHGGSGFMLDSLDFYGSGDTRIAVFDWTGLSSLNSGGREVRFGGQLFSGTGFYEDLGLTAPQKAGPIPLGDECGAAGLSVAPKSGGTAPASCPEGGIETNGDNFTQAGQAQGQLWGAVSTVVAQSFPGEASPEDHLAALYFAVGTGSFDRHGVFTVTSEGYVSPAHEDLSMPVVAAEGLPSQDGGNGGAIIAFTLTGNGGPTGADNGGYYPSTAFALLNPASGGITGPVHIVDLGQAPQDGFTEYLGYPGPTSPRWGDYSGAIYEPGTGRIYFANEYIPYPACTGSAFTLTLGTCGGTRDGNANWGTSVNSVVP